MAQRQRRQNHENHTWLLIMLAQLYQQVDRMPYKPPVTLGISALCLVAHLQPSAVALVSLDYSEHAICLAPAPIIAGGGDALLRLVGSAFVHGSDSHVYYNIASFIFKGVQLEQAMGPELYAMLVGTMLLLSHGLVVLVAWIATFFGYTGWYVAGDGHGRTTHAPLRFATTTLLAHSIIHPHPPPGTTRAPSVFRP